MTADRRLLCMRRLAWACVLLMLVVTSASAWLRLAQPRPACHDWPGCRGEARIAMRVQVPNRLGDPLTLIWVRGTHRAAASAVLLLVLGQALLALVRRPRQTAAGRLALALLLLALALSWLGIATPGSRAPGVLLGNLLGGLLMLGLSWRLLRGLDAVPQPAQACAASAGAALWAAQAGLGALSGAGLLPAAPIAHAALALLAVPWAFALGWRARRDGRRREGSALMIVACVQALLGGAAAAVAAAPAWVLLHNVVAASGLALMLGLGCGARGRVAAVAPARD